MMFGYATNETRNMLFGTWLFQETELDGKENEIPYLRPDAKSQPGSMVDDNKPTRIDVIEFWLNMMMKKNHALKSIDPWFLNN
jgi:S-adenosylmethionine synthetase